MHVIFSFIYCFCSYILICPIFAAWLKASNFHFHPWGHSADTHLSLWTLMKFPEIYFYQFHYFTQGFQYSQFPPSISTTFAAHAVLLIPKPSCAYPEPCRVPRSPCCAAPPFHVVFDGSTNATKFVQINFLAEVG